MKTIKKFYLFIFLSFFMFLCTIVLSPNASKANGTRDYGYTIQNYDIKIDVKDDNVLYIHEVIDVYFAQQRHGIYRTIPTKNEVLRENGKTETRYALVTDIDVNKSYSTSSSDSYIQLRIGDENKLVSGQVKYKISYKYNLGPDPLKDMDELYFNIIGNEWTTNIQNAYIEINMPKDFDGEKVKIVHGVNGYDSTDKINVLRVGNTIEIFASNLDAFESVTIKAELPEEYFTGESYLHEGLFDRFMGWILPIILALLIVLLWYFKGRDEDPVEVVSFYPPQGFNSLEVGYFYAGKPKSEHVIALIIELASKGYIEIEDIPDENSFRIVRIKDYDGDDADLRSVFRALLPGNYKDITEDELNDSFYTTIQGLTSKMKRKSKTKKFKIYEDFKVLGITIGITSTVLILLSALICPCIKAENWLALFLPIVLVAFMTPFNIIVFNKNIGAPIVAKVMIMIFNVAVAFASFMVVSPLFIYSEIAHISIIIALICAVISLFFTIKMPKRAKENLQIYGEILGFKNFLEVAEKDRLEALIMQDPEYFYKTIPYAYVLDVSDKWIKKFEGLAIIPTNYTSTTFLYSSHRLNRMCNSISRSYTSKTTSSSSGGGGGGGFSGGGSGGGGGGSW